MIPSPFSYLTWQEWVMALVRQVPEVVPSVAALPAQAPEGMQTYVTGLGPVWRHVDGTWRKADGSGV